MSQTAVRQYVMKAIDPEREHEIETIVPGTTYYKTDNGHICTLKENNAEWDEGLNAYNGTVTVHWRDFDTTEARTANWFHQYLNKDTVHELPDEVLDNPIKTLLQFAQNELREYRDVNDPGDEYTGTKNAETISDLLAAYNLTDLSNIDE